MEPIINENDIEEKNRKIRQMISQKKEFAPFDNLAINRKKIRIIDCISNNEKPIIQSRNILFEEHYPLINIISNRNSLNHSKNFMQNMFTYQNLSQTEVNVIKYQTYKQPIKLFSLRKKLPLIYNNYFYKINKNDNNNNDGKEDSFREKKRLYINDKMSKSVSIKSARKRNNLSQNEIPLSKQFSLLYKKSKEDYKKKNLESHFINIKNQENLKNKNIDDNYALNGYKIRQPDVFLDTLRFDASKLKFNNHLKLHSYF